MSKQESPTIQQKNSLEDHQTDLKEAIQYLPRNYNFKRLCKLLKHVYGDRGKAIAREWAAGAKVTLPSNFAIYWRETELTSYQRQNFDSYVCENLYDEASDTGWTPKALRHGKQVKKPPKMKLIKEKEEELDRDREHENTLLQIRERNLDQHEQSFISPKIVNLAGACYAHPFMKKEDIPESSEEYLRKLDKIVDCEVRVLEAIEQITERPGRATNEIHVTYKLELNNREDKRIIAEVNQDDITTLTRFSTFLVSKGFIKFIGTRAQFNRFHEFLINGQQYPTLIQRASWGETKPDTFLFENGLYKVKEGKFYEADEQKRIKCGPKHVLCPSGSEQVRPPLLAQPQADTQAFLQNALLLWEEFNGSINVRTTIGYAVATLFSRRIISAYNGFPLLFKFGERGTGKSTSMDWFMALFGYRHGNRQSVSKQNTTKAIIRRMTLPSYFPFFLDDYRDHQTNSNAPDLTSPILNWFEHIGTGMAAKTTDVQTIDTPMRAAVVMTGNDKPTDPAVLSRMIMLNYTHFLNKDQQRKVKRIANHTDRLSEFTYLVLQNYQQIGQELIPNIEANKNWLADQGFEGRTSLIWGIVLAGYQCLPHILPGLTTWHSDFKGLRSQICQKIKREAALQNQQAPLYDFFEALTHFSTMKADPDDKTVKLLDHRHFRIKEEEEVADHNGQVIYEGPVLAIHMGRIWSSLQDVHAAVTKTHHRPKILTMLTNSRYYLAKSQQVHLTAERGARKEKNLRCYYLSVDALEKYGRLGEVIGKAREYEQNRHFRIH